MSMQDPIADMLTRIRNAQSVGETQVKMPFSGLKVAILKVLEAEGYIQSHDVLTNGRKKDLNVVLKYYQGRPVIEKIQRVSRPGLRVYKRINELTTVQSKMGISVVSTSHGVMTGRAALEQKLGGEVLCVVE